MGVPTADSIRILGLDPGSRHTGYGVVEKAGNRLRVLAHGRISPPARGSHCAKLTRLASELAALLERWQPDTAVLEAPFLGLNPRTLVVLAQARGALLAALGSYGAEVREYAPAEIKAAVTGFGQADKQQVSRMVRMILDLEDSRLEQDAADALAAAVCYAHRSGLERLVEQKGPAKKGSVQGRSE